MPHVDIKMFPGRDDELKKKVADAVLETMVSELGCAKEHLSVAISDVAPEEWNEKVGNAVEESSVYAGKVFKAE